MSRTDMCSPHDLFESAFGISQLTIGLKAAGAYSNVFGEREIDNLDSLIDHFLEGKLRELNTVASEVEKPFDAVLFEVTYAFFKALVEYIDHYSAEAGEIPSVFYYINALAKMNFMKIIAKMKEKRLDLISEDVEKKYEGNPSSEDWDGFLPTIRPVRCQILYLFQSKYKQTLSSTLEQEPEEIKTVLELILLINVFKFYNSLKNDAEGQMTWKTYTRDLNLDNLHLDPLTKRRLDAMKRFSTTPLPKSKLNYKGWIQNYKYTSQATKRSKGRASRSRSKRQKVPVPLKTNVDKIDDLLREYEVNIDENDKKIEEIEREKNASFVGKILREYKHPFQTKTLDFKKTRNSLSSFLRAKYVSNKFIDSEVQDLQDHFFSYSYLFVRKLEYEQIVKLRENLRAYKKQLINFTLLKHNEKSFLDLIEEEMKSKLKKIEQDNKIIEKFVELALGFTETLKVPPNEGVVNASVTQFCEFVEKNLLQLQTLKDKLPSDIFFNAFQKSRKALEKREILQLAKKIMECVRKIDASDTFPSAESEKDTQAPDSENTSENDMMELAQAVENEENKMDSREEGTQSISSSEEEEESESPRLMMWASPSQFN